MESLKRCCGCCQNDVRSVEGKQGIDDCASCGVAARLHVAEEGGEQHKEGSMLNKALSRDATFGSAWYARAPEYK